MKTLYRLALLVLCCTAMQAAAFDLSALFGGSRQEASPAVSDPSCRFGELEEPLDLLEAVERALCHHPQTRQAWAQVRAQEAQMGIGRSAFLPSLDGALSRVRSRPKGGEADEAGNGGASLTLGWTLFDFGQRSASLDSARHLLAAAGANRDAVTQSVLLAAAQAYFDVLTAQAAFGATQEAERSARESFLAADARHKAGAGILADKLQAQAAYAEATLARIRAEGEVKNAHGTLAVAIGLNANARIAVSADNAVLPDVDFMESVDDLIADAIATHPLVAAAEAQLLAAQSQTDATRAEGLPLLSLTGLFSRNRNPLSPLSISAGERSIGLQLNIPFLDWFGRSHRVAAMQAQVDAHAAELASTENQVSLDVWKSYHALRTETENIAATGELLQSASQSFRIAQGRYKAGVGTILELLNAQSQLANAQHQRVQALSGWRTTRLKLAASLGRLGLWDISGAEREGEADLPAAPPARPEVPSRRAPEHVPPPQVRSIAVAARPEQGMFPATALAALVVPAAPVQPLPQPKAEAVQPVVPALTETSSSMARSEDVYSRFLQTSPAARGGTEGGIYAKFLKER